MSPLQMGRIVEMEKGGVEEGVGEEGGGEEGVGEEVTGGPLHPTSSPPSRWSHSPRTPSRVAATH